MLEVLAVVTIAAILTGLVVFRMGGWGGPESAERQLERLQVLIEAHCEQTMFQSRSRGVRVTDSGYDFWQSTASGWVALPAQGINRSRQWPANLDPQMAVGGHRVDFSRTTESPQLVCQPLGERTDFELVLGPINKRFRLSMNAAGSSRLEPY